jgi:hypothetical protein
MPKTSLMASGIIPGQFWSPWKKIRKTKGLEKIMLPSKIRQLYIYQHYSWTWICQSRIQKPYLLSLAVEIVKNILKVAMCYKEDSGVWIPAGNMDIWTICSYSYGFLLSYESSLVILPTNLNMRTYMHCVSLPTTCYAIGKNCPYKLVQSCI